MSSARPSQWSNPPSTSPPRSRSRSRSTLSPWPPSRWSTATSSRCSAPPPGLAPSIEVRGIVRLPPSLPTGSGSGSLDRAVAVMLKQHRPLFRLSALTMVAVVAAAISIAWLKMETIWALVATAVFVGCFVAIAATLSRLDRVMNLGHMIHGDAHVDVHNERGDQIDLARLDANDGHVIQRQSTFSPFQSTFLPSSRQPFEASCAPSGHSGSSEYRPPALPGGRPVRAANWNAQLHAWQAVGPHEELPPSRP
uniref:Uncharacterized protein n=1 Tax=Emiliania huxleyi TaxID=2903 RepID=A0A7S3TKT7_EMIHU